MTESEITTDVQRRLGRALSNANQETQGYTSPRTIHQGVEVPVTSSGLY